MGRESLINKIRLGEDSFLELKAVHFSGAKVRGPSPAALADELAAFANSCGGTLVLGVRDSPRAVEGIPLERLDAVERLVLEACEQSVTPPLSPVVERMTLPDAGGDERPVVRVAVPRSLFVHESPGGYLHRVGSSKRRLHPDQLARLFQQRSQSRLIRFDETPVPTARLDDLEEALWRRFVPADSDEADEVLLQKLAIAALDDAGEWRPTVAGVLMASPDPRRFLPTAYIQAVAYRGTTVAPADDVWYQLDAQDISGPLDRQIFEACAFVRRNMRVAAYKSAEGGRVDLPQYAMRAVFEAVVNAVAHRDYSMPGSRVRLRMFNDRFELHSPGMLPNTMTTGDLAFRQSARNEAIASLLARCAIADNPWELRRRFIMDRRGEGVPVILRESETLSGRRPEYRLLGDSELMLTVHAANPEMVA